MEPASILIAFDPSTGNFSMRTEASLPLAEMMLAHALASVQREQLALRLGAPTAAGIVRPNGPIHRP